MSSSCSWLFLPERQVDWKEAYPNVAGKEEPASLPLATVRGIRCVHLPLTAEAANNAVLAQPSAALPMPNVAWMVFVQLDIVIADEISHQKS